MHIIMHNACTHNVIGLQIKGLIDYTQQAHEQVSTTQNLSQFAVSLQFPLPIVYC